MSGINFEVTGRDQTNRFDVIHAEIKNLGWRMKLYLDIDTGDVLYSVAIEKGIFDITIMLDSKDMVSCSFPPSISESEVDSIRDSLGTVHETIAAARKLINEQVIK